ncbi:MAG: hypothetical protein U0930_06575 [Pirellulales bacterium]
MTVDSKFAGKKGKCNKCGGVVEVPADASTGSPTSAAKPAPGNATAKQAGARPTAASPTGQAARPQAARPAGATPTGATSAGQVRQQSQPGSAQPIDLAAALNAAPPPSAAGIKVSGPLDHVMDELTESDFNRSSPYQNVYAPPKPKAVKNAMLDKAAQQEDEDGSGPKMGKDGRPKLTGTLLVFGVLDILEALLMFAVAIALAFLGFNIPEDIKDKLPFVGAGFAVLIVIIGFWSTVMMASGLGILTKQIWGYCTALSVYSFQLGFRLIALLTSITDVQRIGGPIFGLICMLSCTAYFWNEDCKRVYDVPKKSKLPLIFGGIGFGIALMFGLLLFLLGAFAAAAASGTALPQ